MKLTEILKTTLLEYSEKTIKTTVDRWKQSNPKVDDNTARQLIQRFDQVKDGLANKLNQLSLSDELKQGNNYLNIDKYSFDDMVKLIRSIPENEDKIKKEAIKQFMDKEKIDKQMAAHYVIRFMNNKRNLKYAAENGTENGNFDKEEVLKFIPKQLMFNNAYLDPRSWPFVKLEHMLDALFPYVGKAGEEDDTNSATTNADKVYDKDGLEVYRGDAQHKCISYNPNEGGQKKYGWCIAQPKNTNYDYYRFQGDNNRMFYIVFDRTRSSEGTRDGIKDKWHAFVIHVGEGNKKYWITSAKNDADREFSKWSDLEKIAPEVWPKLKGIESVFKYVPPSKAEISAAALRGKKISANDFKELDYETKEQYVQSNAGSLSPEILKVLDKELKNIAINYGQKFPYSDLKDNEGLAKRYAIFRFRHTDYSKDPIPLPYVKYLDDAAKQKYLDVYDDNLNFDYINKYFGDKATENYVEKQLKTLDYLPKEAEKYIKDPKLKKLFLIYNQLFESWEFDDNYNIDENELEVSVDMPLQGVTPKPLSVEQWKNFSSQEKKSLIELAEQVNGKEKYSTLLYALPFIITKGDKKYILLPENNKESIFEDWVLTDIDGNIVKKGIKGNESSINKEPLIIGYPRIQEDPRRIYDSKELNINGEEANNLLKESKYEDWYKHSLMRKAGIYK